MSRFRVLLVAAICLQTAAFSTIAQDQFPSRAVKFVTASVGSPQDVIGRMVGQKLAEAWGQPVIVENRPGAGSLVSIASAAKAPPDGYTMLLSSSAFAVTPSLTPGAGYNAEKDFVPVTLIASTPNIIVSGPALNVSSLKEAVEKARTGKLNYGSPGLGTTPQLSAEYLLKSLARVSVVHVPYAGAAPAITAVAGGQIELASVAMPAATQLVKAGKLRGLAVTGSKRSTVLPEVPTIAEAGFAGFEDVTWVGIWLPTGTPAAIANKVAADTAKVMALADTRERLASMGYEAMDSTPAQFSAFLKQEVAKWAKVVKETGAKAE